MNNFGQLLNVVFGILGFGLYFVFPRQVAYYSFVKAAMLMLFAVAIISLASARGIRKIFLVVFIWFLAYMCIIAIVTALGPEAVDIKFGQGALPYVAAAMYLTGCVRNDIQLVAILKGLYWVSIVTGPVAGLIQFFYLGEPIIHTDYWLAWHKEYARLTTLSEPDANYAMLPLLFSLALGTALARIVKGRLARFVYFSSLTLTILALVFTYSRSGWIATFVLLMILLVLEPGKRKWGLAFGVTSVTVTVLAIASALGWLEQFLAGFGKLQRLDPSNLIIRLELWRAGMLVIADNPLIGLGILDLRNIVWSLTGYYMSIHNLYLKTLLQGGLLLFTFLIFLVSYITYNFLRAFQFSMRNSQEAMRLVTSSMFAGFASYLVMVGTLSDEIGFYLWAYLGFSLACRFLVGRAQKEPGELKEKIPSRTGRTYL
ncbi:MAG: O-antigen ligase family protein [Bacillota bacterium]|nr:O-antigen ligase family protein [Bacillota bacterium]